jgi:hypothetical protein
VIAKADQQYSTAEAQSTPYGTTADAQRSSERSLRLAIHKARRWEYRCRLLFCHHRANGYVFPCIFVLHPKSDIDETDLQTMEYKLENNHYASVDDFLYDAHLIFNNCRRYNGEKSTYTTQANKLEKALERIMKKRNLS